MEFLNTEYNIKQGAVERVLKLMDENNVSTVKLATDLSLAKNVVSEWKNGRIKPSIEAIVYLAQYFNVSTDYILMGKENNANDIANEKGNVIMNASARNSLKRLVAVFKHFRDLARGDNSKFKSRLEDFESIRDKMVIELLELGATEDILYEWSVSNFDNPPTVQQLKEILSILTNGNYKEINMFSKSMYNAINKNMLEIDALYAKFIESCETAINDYRYYIESDSRNKAQKATEDEINIKANNA